MCLRPPDERRYDTELPPSANTTPEAAVTIKETMVTMETSLVTTKTVVTTEPRDPDAPTSATTQVLTSDLVTLETSTGKFVSQI